MVDGEHDGEWGAQIAALKEIDRLLRVALDKCRAMQADVERETMAETGQDNEPESRSSQI